MGNSGDAFAIQTAEEPALDNLVLLELSRRTGACICESAITYRREAHRR